MNESKFDRAIIKNAGIRKKEYLLLFVKKMPELH